MGFRIFLLLLTALIAPPTNLYAQDDIPLSKYTQSEVINGYPTSTYGKKIKLPFLRSPAFVSIPPKGDFEDFYVVWEDYSVKQSPAWLIKEQADSSYKASKLYLQKLESDKRDSHFYIQETVKTADYKHSLALVWDKGNDKLYHKWTGKVKRNGKLVKKGERMPEFSVPLLNGGRYQYRPGQDKILVVNWWQTTCPPCIEEMPGMNKLVKKYSNTKKVEFLAIAWNKREDLNEFLKDHTFAYRQGLYNQNVAELFGGAFPRNLIINSKGKIVYNTLGGSKNQWKGLDKVLSELVRR